jgi:hypothetical protein
MYEMEGASPGCATLGRQLPGKPGVAYHSAGTEYPREDPVSRFIPRPGVTPGWFPFPTEKVFLLLFPGSRKSLRQFILSFSLSTRDPQTNSGYPPAYTQLIHKLPNVIQ